MDGMLGRHRFKPGSICDVTGDQVEGYKCGMVVIIMEYSRVSDMKLDTLECKCLHTRRVFNQLRYIKVALHGLSGTDIQGLYSIED